MEEGSLPNVQAVRRANDKIAPLYTRASFVAHEIFNRLQSRLDYLSVEPKVVLDLGCGDMQPYRLLKKKYPKSVLVGLDISMPMLGQAYRRRSLFSKPRLLQADAHSIALANDSCDLVLSNMMFPLCAEPGKIFKEINRVLKPGGALLFSSLGPDSFRSVLTVLERHDPHHLRADFFDMHDLGDAMAEAGLAQPVLDIEYLDVNYGSAQQLLKEMRDCGVTNVAQERFKGLMTPRKAKKIERSIADLDPLGFSLEIIQGHAWKGGSLPHGAIPIVPL